MPGVGSAAFNPGRHGMRPGEARIGPWRSRRSTLPGSQGSPAATDRVPAGHVNVPGTLLGLKPLVHFCHDHAGCRSVRAGGSRTILGQRLSRGETMETMFPPFDADLARLIHSTRRSVRTVLERQGFIEINHPNL